MNKTDRHINHVWRVVGVIILCCSIAFAYQFIVDVLYENTANKHWQGERYNLRKNNTENKRFVDSCVQLLQSGDLVVRRGDDMTSYMLSKLNTNDKRYSHCGIAIVEHDQVYVYHSIGGEDNPDAKMRKDKARDWFSSANNTAFGIYRYAITDSINFQFLNVISQYHKDQIMFDMEFDMNTDDRMYCSEMIYKAMKKVLLSSLFIKEGNRQGRAYVAVDDLYLNERTKLICQIKFK